MARPLDLDKVRQAWDLRRQGRQQKEIARSLELSLRHTQNYLSLDWLAQRCLRSLAKGDVEAVNTQLKILWGLGQNGRENNSPSSSRSNGRGSNGPASNGNPNGKGGPCPSPSQWPDVGILEGWGIPEATAPGMLGAWRRAHREGAHGVCGFWAELSANVQTGMPFADAYDLTTACCFSSRDEAETIGNIAEIFRLFRPWEGKTNLRVYLDEVRHTLEERLNGSTPTELAAAGYALPRRFLQGNFKSKGEADQPPE